jgi:hypothetical protein
VQKTLITTFLFVLATACAPISTASVSGTVVISVIGTNDVHGELIA